MMSSKIRPKKGESLWRHQRPVSKEEVCDGGGGRGVQGALKGAQLEKKIEQPCTACQDKALMLVTAPEHLKVHCTRLPS